MSEVPEFTGEPNVPDELVQGVTFASFWQRLLASIIDLVMFGMIYVALIKLFTFRLSIATLAGAAAPFVADGMAMEFLFAEVATLVLFWLYVAILECSVEQATFGKKAMAIVVTDKAGKRISFLRASARFCIKYAFIFLWAASQIPFHLSLSDSESLYSPEMALSMSLSLFSFLSMLLLVYSMFLVAGSAKRQALHDWVAGTKVVD